MRTTLIFILICFYITEPAFAWSGRVVTVIDGDTIIVEPVGGGDRIKVRLQGIDCPERRQAFGEAARFFVNERALFRSVEVDEKGKDRYGRVVAIVYFASPDISQRNGGFCRFLIDFSRLH